MEHPSLNRVVIFGCGYVGNALGEMLTADGVEVWGVRRRAELLAPCIKPISADLCDLEALEGQLPPCDGAVYCAAADRSDESAYQRAYLDGLKASAQRLVDGKHPVKRFLFTSSTVVYGQKDGSIVDEQSPTTKEHFRGRILGDAETFLRTLAFPAASVRLSGIYGPGRTRLLRKVAAGEAALEDPDRFTNRIHRDDCAGVLRHLLYAKQIEPTYLASDNCPVTWNEVLRYLAELLKAPTPLLSKPAETGSHGAQQVHGVEKRGTPLRSRGAGKRCNNALLRSSGYTFRYPSFREGYQAVATSIEENLLGTQGPLG